MQFQFSADAWNEYTYWQTQDRRTLKRINDHPAKDIPIGTLKKIERLTGVKLT